MGSVCFYASEVRSGGTVWRTVSCLRQEREEVMGRREGVGRFVLFDGGLSGHGVRTRKTRIFNENQYSNGQQWSK